MANLEVIDLTRQFDLQFYRDIGLELSPLEDPSSNGPVPCLNRAAQMWVDFSAPGAAVREDNRERAKQLLHAKHSVVRALMERTQEAMTYDGIDADHPAFTSWAQRCSDTGLLLPEDHLKTIGDVKLVLVRGVLEAEADTQEPNFVPIGKGKVDYYQSPLDVAPHLANARLALMSGIA